MKVTTERIRRAPRSATGPDRELTLDELPPLTDEDRQLRWRDIDLRETWQVLIGSLLVAIGVVAIVLGSVGAANSPLVAEQIPYVVSGGILGLALTVLGGFFFWGHWLYRQYERNEHHQRATAELLRELIATTRPGAFAAGGGDTSHVPATGDGGALVMTKMGSVIHRSDCSVIRSMGAARQVPDNEARSGGRRACAICDPLGETSR